MIMEYLKFVFAIAMVGALVGLIWRALFAEKAIEHQRFKKHVAEWQESFEFRRTEFTNRSVPVDGEKYEFVPQKVSRARSRSRKNGLPLQRFELIS
jgi:hypothetical protein